MSLAQSLQPRQTDGVNNDPKSPGYCPWWYCSESAYIIKWIIVGALFALFIGFILGAYTHAKRRMAKGQTPLRYHRWLLSRRERDRFFPPPPPQKPYGFYRTDGNGQGQAFPMHNYQYPAPPPAYHEAEAVPVYTPPTKVNPDQSYTAPPGPPPVGYNPEAGSSNLNASGPTQPARAMGPNQNNK